MALELPAIGGKLIISEEAVAGLVGVALLDVPGLSRFPLHKVKDGLRDLLGQPNPSRGIRVFWRDGAVELEIDAVVDPDRPVAELVGEVVRRSREAVSHFTGLTVTEVRVKVLGVKAAEAGRPRRRGLRQ